MSKPDEAAAIELAESARSVAAAARMTYNAFLAEGFTDQQALSLTRAWLQAAVTEGSR